MLRGGDMSIKKSQELKQLQSRKSKLDVECDSLGEQVKELQGKWSSAINQRKALIQKIDLLSCKNIVVTEHAILRYLERAMGLDLDQVRKEILTNEVEQLSKNMGNGKYPIGNGCRVVVKNNTVVSVTN